jgi:hypothetical protein
VNAVRESLSGNVVRTEISDYGTGDAAAKVVETVIAL